MKIKKDKKYCLWSNETINWQWYAILKKMGIIEYKSQKEK
jgi:hypothetical protein